jgi:biopolymer transport protein ExbD
MSIRRKKRPMGEVNMSSMTDIIFMLLIFFMLTSTLVKFFPFKLPESGQRTNAAIKTTLSIEKSGKLAVNDVEVSPEQLEVTLRNALLHSPNPSKPTITIAAEKGVAFGEVTKLMAVASRLKAEAILATDPKE